MLREDVIMDTIAGFFDQYVFGHDCAALLAAQLPATTAEHAEARARQETHLRAELARIDTAERGLISELEAPGTWDQRLEISPRSTMSAR